MSSKNGRGAALRRDIRYARTGGLWVIGVAIVAVLCGAGSPAQAALPGLNGRLACEGTRNLAVPSPPPAGSSGTEVFTVNPDGTDERVLTNNTVRDGDPAFSPDGSLISFESFVLGFSEAYLMGSDGSNVTRLTESGNNEDRGTSWSPDGTKIAFHSTRDAQPPPASSFEIYVMNADGSNQVRLTNNTAQDSLPAWSPDGSRLAFTTNRDGDFEIYTMNPDGTDVVRVTNSPGEDAHPTWSPDGAQLTFHSRRGSVAGTPLLEIWRSKADGSDPTPVTTPATPGFKFFPVWSPDGARIAFNGNLDPAEPSNTDVYHVNGVDGSDPVRVTSAPGFDGRCDWERVLRQAPPPPAPAAPPQPVQPVSPPAIVSSRFTAKLSIARATINRRLRMLDVLAPITARASGRVRVELHAAGRRFRFSAPIDSVNGRIRFRQRIPAAQARLGTGIITITYAGDADTRPQTVRLRAAIRPAILRLGRPRIVNDRLQASGTVSERARGVVRLQLEFVRGGETRVLRFRAPIANGRWSLNEQLSVADAADIAQRIGTVHSYTLFTGYQRARMRGEMRSFQVLGDR